MRLTTIDYHNDLKKIARLFIFITLAFYNSNDKRSNGNDITTKLNNNSNRNDNNDIKSKN